ncbi:MAG: serine/threonine protein kinase [Candidatus Wallbacteria bacterium]|nr:serine/threonine protein kinase [Candidatus Wallbacteria bacterium]
MIQVPGYRIIRKLAVGGGGTVFLAEQSSLNRRVALKLLATGLFPTEEARRRFLNEAHFLFRLTHPNVVAVYDAEFAGERAFIAMEHLEGGSLRAEMHKAAGLLPLPRVLEIVAAVARGLHHAHQAGVVHRDLKPENVFLGAKGEVKVGDFGLATSERKLAQVDTQRGMVLGTAGYIAPEVITGGKASPASDVYSLGVVLFELVAGPCKPLEQLRRDQAAGKVAVPLPAPSRMTPDLPPELDSLIVDCLAPEPASRPPLPGLIRRLDKLRQQFPSDSYRLALESSSGVITAAEPLSPAPTAPIRSGWVLPVALLAVIAVLLAAAGFIRQQGGLAVLRGRLEAGGAPAEAAAVLADPWPAPIQRVTAGGDRIRIHLASPAERDCSVELVDVATDKGAVLQLARGAMGLSMSGLTPDRAYIARPAGRPEAAIPVRTMPLAAAAEAVQLFRIQSPETTFASRLKPREERPKSLLTHVFVDIAQDGDAVFVLAGFNGEKSAAAWLAESSDGGETWFEPLVVGRVAKEITDVHLFASGGAVVAAWCGYDKGGQELWVTRRQKGSMEWLAPFSIPAGSRPPAVLMTADGLLRAMIASSVSAGRTELEYVEHEIATGRQLLRAPGPEMGDAGKSVVDQKLLESGAGLLWVARSAAAYPLKQGVYSWCGRPELGVWERLRSFGPPEKEMGAYDLAQLGGAIIAAYEVSATMNVRSSSDAMATLAPAKLEPPPSWVCSDPGLVTDGKQCFLAFLDAAAVGTRVKPSLFLYASKDARSWKLVASKRAMLAACRHLYIASGSGSVNIVMFDELEGVLAMRLAL